MSAIDQAFIRAYESDVRRAAARLPIAARDQTARPLASTELAGDHSAVQRSAAPAPHFRLPADSDAPAGAEISPTEPTAERRPLSTFAAARSIVAARFRPALEVDHFRWSAVSDELVDRRHDRLRPALHTLLAADDGGRSLIGISAATPGAGCTTVLACLARLLVEAGKTVAIVDGNFASPGLASQLGLVVDAGWEEVLAGGLPLAESVVYSLTDRVALLPLTRGGAAAAEKLAGIQASVTAGVLRYHYDIVLFDLGAIGDPVQGPIARQLARQCRLDGMILTSGGSPSAAVEPQRLTQIAPELASLCLGVIENQSHAA